ncbi:MAG: hypothetical protein SGBAC_002102 [Bacillariaceae sp.]
MKFGNRFKKQQPLIPQDVHLQGSDSINTERARGGPSPVGWELHKVEGSPNKKGSLHVLKKLNCGAAVNNKDRYEDNQYPGFNPQTTYRPTYVTPPVVQESSHCSREQTQQSTPRKLFNKNRNDTRAAVRPVLITVNDGDLGEQHNHTPNQPQQTAEFKSTFLVGPGGTTEDPMNRRPARTVTPEKQGGRKPKACVMTPRRLQGSDALMNEDNRNCMVPRKGARHDKAKDMEDLEELQRIARKNRWKRGVERRWKDDGDLASASAFGEESTAFSSYLTYDESEDYDSYTTGSMGSSQWTGYTGPSTKRQSRSKSLSRKRGGSVFDNVAEDLGIMAKMLLSDGTSCISGAVDITRETIVSCKQT